MLFLVEFFELGFYANPEQKTLEFISLTEI